MNDISHILSLTMPVFILMGLGYLSVRAEWLTKEHNRILGWFVIYFGLPAAMFKALGSRHFADILHYEYLLIFAGGSLISFTILFWLARVRGKGLTESAFFGLGGSISNSLMIGFPIIVYMFGDAALVPFALTLIVENLLILPLALALADTGQTKGMSFFRAFLHSFPQLIRNPIIVSIVLGFLSALFGLQPPAMVGRVIDSLAATVGGLALFTIGGMLVGFKAKGMVADISTIVLGKLVIHPLGVLVMILVMPPIPPLFQSVAIILACMPMFSVYAVLGVRYSLEELCSAVLLPTVLFSFITINIAVWFVGTN